MYTCNLCKIQFSHKHALQYHKDKEVCVQKKNRLTCKYCDLQFTTTRGLKAHYTSKKHITVINNTTNNKSFNDKSFNDHSFNTTNNTTNNITNNNTFNILVINEFVSDKEMSYLSPKTTLKILNKKLQSLCEIIKQTNFDSNLPENHNIYITNLKSKHGYVYDGLRWNAMNKEDMLREFIFKKLDDIEDLLDIHKDNISEFVRTKVQEIVDVVHDENPSTKKSQERRNKVIEDIELLIYNNREVPIHTRKGVKK